MDFSDCKRRRKERVRKTERMIIGLCCQMRVADQHKRVLVIYIQRCLDVVTATIVAHGKRALFGLQYKVSDGTKRVIETECKL
jgi:hypothetical protein